jgi:WD40 repeat protein
MAVPESKPLFDIKEHGNVDGYGVDLHLNLLTGDGKGRILLTTIENDRFQTQGFFKDHTSSIEDLQWSHSQSNVFASCSADQTIRIWDTRVKKKAQLTIHAHDSDVNVISWNRYISINSAKLTIYWRVETMTETLVFGICEIGSQIPDQKRQLILHGIKNKLLLLNGIQ